MKDTFIYALRNPETKTVFYIGKANSPKKRLSNHLHTMRSYFNIPDLYLCIKGIVDNGFMPELLVLDKVAESEWEEKEQFYIEQHTARGIILLNLTKGGKVFGKECALRSVRKNSKPILQYDSKGNYIREWVSIREAARRSNCAKSSIYASLNTKHKTAIGFFWRFKLSGEIPKEIITQNRTYTSKPIFQILENGERKRWNSIREAAKNLGLHESYLSAYIRKGWKGKYVFEKDMSNKRWHKPFGKLNQKLVNYNYIDPSEYSLG